MNSSTHKTFSTTRDLAGQMEKNKRENVLYKYIITSPSLPRYQVV